MLWYITYTNNQQFTVLLLQTSFRQTYNIPSIRHTTIWCCSRATQRSPCAPRSEAKSLQPIRICWTSGGPKKPRENGGFEGLGNGGWFFSLVGYGKLVGGWTVEPTHLNKYAKFRQIGSWIPNFRGEHKRYLSCQPPRKCWLITNYNDH